MDLESIENARAVGVDETTEELFREAIDNGLLPVDEPDLSLMLPPGPMLGKERYPAGACRSETDASTLLRARARSSSHDTRNPPDGG